MLSPWTILFTLLRTAWSQLASGIIGSMGSCDVASVGCCVVVVETDAIAACGLSPDDPSRSCRMTSAVTFDTKSTAGASLLCGKASVAATDDRRGRLPWAELGGGAVRFSPVDLETVTSCDRGAVFFRAGPRGMLEKQTLAE